MAPFTADRCPALDALLAPAVEPPPVSSLHVAACHSLFPTDGSVSARIAALVSSQRLLL